MSFEKKIYVSGGYATSSDHSLWGNLGQIVSREFFYNQPEEVDLLCLTGGIDIAPSVYGHENLASDRGSQGRDAREIADCDRAMDAGVAIAGICRGAQLLNALIGGTLVQDMQVSHGGGRHGFITTDGQCFSVTSAHHQLIVPAKGSLVLGWAEKTIPLESCVYDGEIPAGTIQDPDDPTQARVTEAIAFPEIKALGVQFHPEWMSLESPAVQWTFQMVKAFCFGEALELST